VDTLIGILAVVACIALFFPYRRLSRSAGEGVREAQFTVAFSMAGLLAIAIQVLFL
jgi:hypothetical protein